jgi:hypothetical protein
MVYYDKELYKLEGYRKSNNKKKKYDAILFNKLTGRRTHVPFGASDYEHYRDTTGLGLWSHKDHLDENRRRSYKSRHKGYLREGYYSPSYFSFNVLW